MQAQSEDCPRWDWRWLAVAAAGAPATPTKVVGAGRHAQRDAPDRPEQLRRIRRRIPRRERTLERDADVHQPRLGHQHGDDRGRNYRQCRRNAPTGERHEPARENLTPTLDEPEREDRPARPDRA